MRTASAEAGSATGGLFGVCTAIINVDSGGDYDADPTALERFNPFPGPIYVDSGTDGPLLSQAAPPESIVFDARW